MIHFIRVSPKRWIYFGLEDEAPEAKVWEPFWFIEENPPYRHGHGRRSRQPGEYAVHIGTARVIPLRESPLNILGGSVLDIPAHEVGLWGDTTATDDTGEAQGPVDEDQLA